MRNDREAEPKTGYEKAKMHFCIAKSPIDAQAHIGLFVVFIRQKESLQKIYTEKIGLNRALARKQKIEDILAIFCENDEIGIEVALSKGT